jgi:hypothetical protein
LCGPAACEVEHERHASSLRSRTLSDVMALEALREEARKKHALDAEEMSAALVAAKREHEGAHNQVARLEQRITVLVEENARLEGDHMAAVAKARQEAQESAARQAGLHTADVNRLEAIVERLTGEKSIAHEQVRQRIEELERAKEAHTTAMHQMELNLDGADARRRSETARLQREVDHVRALQTAALAAGSYKGRQLLCKHAARSNQLLAASAALSHGHLTRAPPSHKHSAAAPSP